MYCENGRVYIENDDQCLDCRNYAEGVSCPLLTALGLGVVYLEDSLVVTNCGFFEQFDRRLHLVRDDEENNID